MNAIRQLLKKVKSTGTRLAGQVKTVSMGRERVFEAYNLGDDTFVFERGVSARLAERPSVLVVDRRWLRRRGRGKVMTVTTGNHAVAAMPLLDGRFWKLSSLPVSRRSDVMTSAILCANIVDGRLEVSQRDVPTPELVSLDRWLVDAAGLGLGGVVMLDRNESALDHYRRLGQEWRVKPLVWTEKEMLAQLAASRKRISSKTRYYHSSRGVHFLTYPEFMRLVALAETSPADFVAGLREIVSIFEGNTVSFARMPKYRGHHEIEFFGLGRGVGVERIVPELEKLMEAVALGRLGQLGVIQKARDAAALYESLLTTPEFADESSPVFVEKLYMYVTGEVYSVVGDGSTPSFDDRRTALPGATFVGGRPVMHPGADVRSEVLLSNLRGLLSKDELVEYANIYELREDDSVPVGRGRTREVVYKTNMRPLVTSLIEKGLSSRRRGYAEYMLARIGALRAMGVSMSAYYRVLRRRPSTRSAPSDFYIRMRCEGEPIESIPANWFRSGEDSSVEVEDVVLGLAALMGDAAAQNMAMKKFDPKTESPLYGVGKDAAGRLVLQHPRVVRLAGPLLHRPERERLRLVLLHPLRARAEGLLPPPHGADGRSRGALHERIRVPHPRDGMAALGDARRLRVVLAAGAAGLPLRGEVALRDVGARTPGAPSAAPAEDVLRASRARAKRVIRDLRRKRK